MTPWEREQAIEAAIARATIDREIEAGAAPALRTSQVVRELCAAPFWPGRCCEAAQKIECVCAAAWRCPTHGEHHHGTHD